MQSPFDTVKNGFPMLNEDEFAYLPQYIGVEISRLVPPP